MNDGVRFQLCSKLNIFHMEYLHLPVVLFLLNKTVQGIPAVLRKSWNPDSRTSCQAHKHRVLWGETHELKLGRNMPPSVGDDVVHCGESSRIPCLCCSQPSQSRAATHSLRMLASWGFTFSILIVDVDGTTHAIGPLNATHVTRLDRQRFPKIDASSCPQARDVVLGRVVAVLASHHS